MSIELIVIAAHSRDVRTMIVRIAGKLQAKEIVNVFSESIWPSDRSQLTAKEEVEQVLQKNKDKLYRGMVFLETNLGKAGQKDIPWTSELFQKYPDTMFVLFAGTTTNNMQDGPVIGGDLKANNVEVMNSKEMTLGKLGTFGGFLNRFDKPN
jgi:hypothetical protein